jgi:hypothetical protein
MGSTVSHTSASFNIIPSSSSVLYCIMYAVEKMSLGELRNQSVMQFKCCRPSVVIYQIILVAVNLELLGVSLLECMNRILYSHLKCTDI